MNGFIYQLKQVFCSLKHKPNFVMTVVISMGITLGSLLCVIILSNLILNKTFPYPEQDKVLVLQHGLYDQKQSLIGHMFPFPSLMHIYKNEAAFKEKALISYYEAQVKFNDNSRTVNLSFATPELSSMLSIPMSKGRFFDANEALGLHKSGAVISYQVWKNQFSLTEDILEQTVNFSGISHKVIGVTAKGFIEPELMATGRKTQVWLPWDFESSSAMLKSAWGMIHEPLFFIGKLTDEYTAENAVDYLTINLNEKWQSEVMGQDWAKGWFVEMRLTPIGKYILGDNKQMLYMLLAASLGLLLIAVVNIANLFISRAAETKHNLAIHSALGASKKAIVKLLFLEIVSLMLLSVVFAIVVCTIEFHILKTYLVTLLPRINELSIDVISVFSLISIAVILSLIFSLLASKHINFKVIQSALSSSGKGVKAQVSKPLRNFLIISQITLVTLMVFVSSIILMDATNTIFKPVGFNANNTMSINMTRVSANKPERAQYSAFMKALKEQTNALPQVKSVTHAISPFSAYAIRATEIDKTGQKFSPYMKWVDNKYFTVIEQTLLQGRNFSDDDIKNLTDVVIINEQFANEIQSGGDVLGLQLVNNNKRYKIIGIVKSIQIPNQPYDSKRAYFPGADHWLNMLVRFNEGQSISESNFRELVTNIDARFDLRDYETVKSVHYKMMFSQITTAITTIVLTLLILFLASIGLYSIANYNVHLRQSELATRLAIGAKKRDIVKLFLLENAINLIIAIGISLVFLIGVYGFYAQELSGFIDINIIPLSFFTLGLVISLLAGSIYLPLRGLIHKPVAHTLKGSE